MEDSFIQQMSSMKDKADKYEHLIGRYNDMANRLEKLRDEIDLLVKELRPQSARVYKERVRKSAILDVIDYAVKYIKSGNYLTLEELEKSFPDRTKGSLTQIFYVEMSKLNDKNILSTKIDGKKQWYYRTS
jgi:hypothetical protein